MRDLDIYLQPTCNDVASWLQVDDVVHYYRALASWASRALYAENPSWLYTDFRLLRTAFLKLLLSQNEFCSCAIFAKSLKR